MSEMSEMTPQKKEQNRQWLLKERDDVQEKIYNLQHSLTETAENDPDPVDVASKVEGRNNTMAESNRQGNRLKQINSALSLFADDEYGLCITCLTDIPEKRMEFDPATTQCVDCKTLSESRGRQFARG